MKFRKYWESLVVSLKIRFYSLLDYFDELRTNLAISLVKVDTQVVERNYQKTKMMRGIKKLVRRLRDMSPEDRTKPENLLCTEPYKKTRKELREALEVHFKLLKNPTLKTEDDLVSKVVKKAPIYQKEQEVKGVRKAITACLKRANQDPTNPLHTQEAEALKAKLSLLKDEIERLKRDRR